MIVFARIDHAKAAEEAGLRLRPAELSSPLIANTPHLGLHFPQRVLVCEDEQHDVSLSYNDPVWLGRRHDINADAIPKLEAIGASLADIAAEATAAKSDVSGA